MVTYPVLLGDICQECFVRFFQTSTARGHCRREGTVLFLPLKNWKRRAIASLGRKAHESLVLAGICLYGRALVCAWPVQVGRRHACGALPPFHYSKANKKVGPLRGTLLLSGMDRHCRLAGAWREMRFCARLVVSPVGFLARKDWYYHPIGGAWQHNHGRTGAMRGERPAIANQRTRSRR